MKGDTSEYPTENIKRSELTYVGFSEPNSMLHWDLETRSPQTTVQGVLSQIRLMNHKSS